jgi:glycosyltransferase involved in cell wall biosynthesis
MRVHLVDPPAFTPPYDHALAAALARAGADVQLITSRFAYGEVPAPEGYVRRELFYRRAVGPAGSRLRRWTKLAVHVPDMWRYRSAAEAADVVHFQWLTAPLLDLPLLPRRPLVLTAHDLLPREPRPGQVRAQRRLFQRVDAIVVHSEYGRRQLVERLGVSAAKVEVIRHGAFGPSGSAAPPGGAAATPPGAAAALPAEIADDGRPVVLLFGLLRPYKGLDTLLAAWRGVDGAQLWIVGRPMMALPPMPAGVTLVPRFVESGQAEALIARADVVVLPYTRTERFDMSGVLAVALGAGRPTVLSDIGGFGEVAATGAARLVPPGDEDALRAALGALVADAGERERLGAAALAAARGPYSWDEAVRATLALYERVRR